MIDYKELKIIGYLKKDYRRILIKYKDTKKIVEFEKYQSDEVLKTLDSYLKEFYRTENKTSRESFSGTNKNRIYIMELSDRNVYKFL